MRRRTLRNACVLADAAEERIRAAGRPVPPRESLLKAVLPAAREVTRAARALERAERLQAEAHEWAHSAAETAADTAAVIAAGWLAVTPRPERRLVDFDPGRFRVALEPVSPPSEPAGEPAREVA